jgi:hypothetical protein
MKFAVQSVNVTNLEQGRQLIAVNTNLIDDIDPELPILATFSDSIIVLKSLTQAQLQTQIVNFLIPAIQQNYLNWQEEQDKMDLLKTYKVAFENKLNEVFG